MTIKAKNKSKKKNKPKIIRKTAAVSSRKNKFVKSVSGGKANEIKKTGEIQATANIQSKPNEIEINKNDGIDKPKKNENGDNSHLAKWIAPNFILTNAEALIYKLCAAGSPFMVIWSILQGSYIVSITFLLAFCVSLMHLMRKPEAMEYLIDLDGIKMGDRLYKYGLIESFEIDEEAKVLKFKLKNAFLPLKEIYLEDQDPNYIRAVLEYFLPEEKQDAVLLSRENKAVADQEEMSDAELLSYLEKMEKKMEKDDM